MDGWFYVPDMLLFAFLGEIQDELGASGDLCEVGVWQGKSLALLNLMRSESERVYGFDLFDDNRQQITEGNLKLVCGERAAVVLVRANSQQCTEIQLRQVMKAPLRFLHIDAGHEFEEALSDLNLFSRFLGDAGIIAVDDYNDRDFPGVCAATHAFLDAGRSSQFAPFAAGHNKLYLCRPAFVERYVRALIEKQPFQARLRLESMYGWPVLLTFAGKLDMNADAVRARLAAWPPRAISVPATPASPRKPLEGSRRVAAKAVPKPVRKTRRR
jgi:hypothetical protein